MDVIFVPTPKIKENWYFECACARCGDVTELGTMADAVACKECPSTSGYMLPKRALDQVIRITGIIKVNYMGFFNQLMG